MESVDRCLGNNILIFSLLKQPTWYSRREQVLRQRAQPQPLVKFHHDSYNGDQNGNDNDNTD